MDTVLSAWLHLNNIAGLGPITIRQLIDRFKTPIQVLELDHATLKRLGFNPKQLAAIKKQPTKVLQRVDAWLQQDHHRVLSYTDAAYPQILNMTKGAPILLYVKGDPCVLNHDYIAVVGSRNPTHPGKRLAYDLSMQLSLTGLGIVSGMALGIDAAAHQAALDAGGVTVAVMGCGLDHIYPASHKNLAQHIIDSGGALLSEFTLAQKPIAAHFPRRNRIISGMSLATLVVEAALKSGSLITARYAGEQGRCVMACPGSVHNPLTQGPHALIRDGALLVRGVDDVLDELNMARDATNLGLSTPPRVVSPCLDDDCQKVLDALGYGIFDANCIVQMSDMDVKIVMICLHKLQQAGMVRESMGLYQRK